MKILLLSLSLLAQGPKPIPVVAPKNPAGVSYAKDVAEILDAKCVGCHSAALAENKLLLEDVKGMLKGGKRGPAIVSGKADESLLFKMAAHRVEPVMPPKDKKGQEPLTPEELGKLKSWIDSGAKDDTELAESPTKRLSLGRLPADVHPISSVHLSPDGNRLAVGRANVVGIFDLADGKELARLGGHSDLVQSVRFSPDGQNLLAGGYGEVIVWKLSGSMKSVQAPIPGASASGAKEKGLESIQKNSTTAETKDKETRQPASATVVPATQARWNESLRLGPHVFRVLAIDVSADGKLVATAGGEPAKSGEIKIWSLADGKLIRSLEGIHSDTVFTIKFSPDGKKLLSGSADRFIKIINVDDGKELKSFEGHTHHVLGVDWKSDGKQFVSAGADGAVKFWDAESGEQLRSTQGMTRPFTSVCWPAGRPRVLVSSSDGQVREINVSNAQVSKTFASNASPADYLYTVDASTDVSKIIGAGADGVLYLWNGVNGSLTRKIEPGK